MLIKYVPIIQSADTSTSAQGCMSTAAKWHSPWQAGAGITEAQLPPTDTKTAPRRKQREVKPLRSQAILHAAHSAKPVKSVKQRQATKRKQPSADTAVQPEPRQQQQQPSRKRQKLVLRDVWTSEDQADRLQQHSRRPSAIPAVEVMDAGSSFNPETKLHQAVLARAVAEETAKANRQLLQPTGVSRKVAAEDAVDLDGLQVCSAPLLHISWGCTHCTAAVCISGRHRVDKGCLPDIAPAQCHCHSVAALCKGKGAQGIWQCQMKGLTWVSQP